MPNTTSATPAVGNIRTLALVGPAAAGKTTLARGILAALGHVGEVPSPSFAIVEVYDPPDVRLPVVHADFYRLSSPAELTELGLDEYRHGAVLLAEWPEHAGGFEAEPGCLSVTLAPRIARTRSTTASRPAYAYSPAIVIASK